MTQSFYLPVKLVHGAGALDGLPDIAKSIGITRVLVVTDKTIGATPYFRKLCDALTAAGVPFRVFDECGIDARLSHVETQTAKLRQDGTDGVIGVGGGSIMCTAKSIATLAANGERLRPLEDPKKITRRTMPMILVPTTAGSGTEVSPFTIVKDDVNGGKFTFGTSLCFAQVAVLDPVVLESLPKRLAAISGADALTHAMEALFSKIATPVTDALGYEAVALLMASLKGSIIDGDTAARTDNLLGSSLANMACSHARLGLGHRLSRPLEETFGINHGVGVGTIMPRGIDFCAEQFPDKLNRLASILDLKTTGGMADIKKRLVEKIFATYEAMGFPIAFDPKIVDRSRLREIAEKAVSRTTDSTARPDRIDDATPILAANGVHATVAQAEQLYIACMA